MFVLRHLRGALVTAIFSLTIIMVTIPIVIFALVKLLIPVKPCWALLNPLLDACANTWIRVNNLQQRLFLPTRLEIEGQVQLSREEWYMLIANHQSWVDILMLVRVYGTDIPGVKFFFKRSLLWVPVLGLALWGLDFPSMRRLSKAQLARNPALKGRDMEETRRFCDRFREHPVTIINFIEGTRFTPVKHQASQSPYQYLLPPKAGGMAFTLSAMNGQLHQLLDVTLCYPEGIPTYWDYACGKVKTVKVHLRTLPIRAERLGNYIDDEAFRSDFQLWVNELWQQKDERLKQLMADWEGH